MTRLVSSIPLSSTNDIILDVLAGPTNLTDISLNGFTITGGQFVLDDRTVSFTLRFDGVRIGVEESGEIVGAISRVTAEVDGGAAQLRLSGFSLGVEEAFAAFGRGGFNELLRITGEADAIIGSQGDDLMRGFAGNDTLTGRRGDDVLSGDAGADRLIGGGGGDQILAGAGDDRAIGGAGDDLIALGAGRDVGLGGGGADTISGGGGNDAISGGGGKDQLFGGGGDDLIRGQGGVDAIIGGGGGDRLIAGGGADSVMGGDGGDLLIGGAGADMLTGGRGDDTLIGGGRADSFVFDENSGGDLIRRFQTAGDLIDISAVKSITVFDDLLSVASDGAAGVEITLSPTSSIVLAGVAITDLSEANFLFA